MFKIGIPMSFSDLSRRAMGGVYEIFLKTADYCARDYLIL